MADYPAPAGAPPPGCVWSGKLGRYVNIDKEVRQPELVVGQEIRDYVIRQTADWPELGPVVAKSATIANQIWAMSLKLLPDDLLVHEVEGFPVTAYSTHARADTTPKVTDLSDPQRARADSLPGQVEAVHRGLYGQHAGEDRPTPLLWWMADLFQTLANQMLEFGSPVDWPPYTYNGTLHNSVIPLLVKDRYKENTEQKSVDGALVWRGELFTVLCDHFREHLTLEIGSGETMTTQDLFDLLLGFIVATARRSDLSRA